eukprot:856936_1
MALDLDLRIHRLVHIKLKRCLRKCAENVVCQRRHCMECALSFVRVICIMEQVYLAYVKCQATKRMQLADTKETAQTDNYHKKLSKIIPIAIGDALGGFNEQKYDESVYCVSNYPASTSSYPPSASYSVGSGSGVSTPRPSSIASSSYPPSVGSVSYSVGSGSAVAISTPPPSSFAPVGYHLKPLTAQTMISSYDLNNNNSVQQLRLPVLNGPQLQFDYERKADIALQRERQRQRQYRMNQGPNHYQGTRNQGNNSSQSRRFHPLNPNGSTSHL